ncbi:hypothetical protein [Pararhizobium sp.]|uniref:hypothetical protein n=1 Tax=Pararhizobium sp. TaxID=1977563 RepID=UPI003D0AF980
MPSDKPSAPRRKHSRFSCLKIWLTTAATVLSSSYGGELRDSFQRSLKGKMPTGSDTEDLILAACDDVYFGKFANSLINSINLAPNKHSLHFHLLKPSPETLQKVEKLKNSISNVRLTYTYDPCEHVNPKNSIGIYYTAARFILAPLLLEQGIKRILLIDVDAIMRKSPWPIIDTMPEDMSAAFIFRRNMRRPWQQILAGAVLLKGSEQGKLFADRLARSLLVNLSRLQSYHLDQIVPYYLSLRGGSSRGYIKDIPPNILSLEYSEDAAFWMPKGKGKHEEKFLNIQSSYLSEENTADKNI